MTDRLIELAALWGVEIEEGDDEGFSRIELAHDLLAKLPLTEDWVLRVAPPNNEFKFEWYWRWRNNEGRAIFEDAVIALAERAGVKP